MDETTNQFAVHSINIVVVGAEGVGKSSITIYMTQGFFIEEYDSNLSKRLQQMYSSAQNVILFKYSRYC